MTESILQSIEQVLAYLDLRPAIWVVVIGWAGGLFAGMAYKKAAIKAVQALTGQRAVSDRCADAHAVLIQIVSGAAGFLLVAALWPHSGGWAVALVVALSCGFVYDVLRALIAIRWPTFSKRLGMPREPM